MIKKLILIGVLTSLFCGILTLIGHAKPSSPVTPPTNNPAPVLPSKPQPGSKVEWLDFQPLKKLSDPTWGDVLTDIENHLDPSMGNGYRFADKNIWAHETTHGIHSYLNNTYNEPGNYVYYCLYPGKNKAVKIKEPKIKIADVAKLVPDSLKRSRFNLYLVQQRRDWNNHPVYLWDEWVAYCNGADCGIELINKGIYKPGKNDSSLAVLEFSVYATYVAIAAQKHEESNKQLLEFLAWNLERSMKLYNSGQKLEDYNWDKDEYLTHLRTSDDAKEFRNFLINTYGSDWANKVFGFK
jgi:hypothetical protein